MEEGPFKDGVGRDVFNVGGRLRSDQGQGASEPREETESEDEGRVWGSGCEAWPRAGRHNGHISAWPPV